MIPGTGSKGRYGSAIVNLGDINSDGFEGEQLRWTLVSLTTDYCQLASWGLFREGGGGLINNLVRDRMRGG